MKRIHTAFPIIASLVLLVPALAAAEGLENPLGDADSIEGVIILLSRSLIGLVAVAATFMFIYGGIMMLTSGGNEKRVASAKETLKWTALGLVFIFLAGAILRLVYQSFGKTGYLDISATIGLGTESPQKTAVNIIRAVLGLLGIASVVMIILGGYWWLTAAGNEQRVERAKKILTSAIIGLIIILLAWAIVWYTIRTSANVTKPATTSFDGTRVLLDNG
jgi:cytochrome bd-type quinol oxidase subunit 2